MTTRNVIKTCTRLLNLKISLCPRKSRSSTLPCCSQISPLAQRWSSSKQASHSNKRMMESQAERSIDQDEEEGLISEHQILNAPITNVGESEGWLSIGPYEIYPWSVSGVESCIVVKSADVNVVFDLGVTIKESVKVPNVFITHGHVDHISGVASHVAKRSLFGMKPARYFVPPHLVDPLKVVTKAHYEMAETIEALEDVNIFPCSQEDTIKLNSRFFVKTFPTIHRIPSQGYILYKEERVLKKEFKGVEGFKVAALHREGKEIHDIITTPEVAYTGDTIFDVFLNPPTSDLLKVKVLITEATFLEEGVDRKVVQKARDRGHIHLVEIIENAKVFDGVGHLVLVHFSNKYAHKYISDCIRDQLPQKLREKTTPATLARRTMSNS